MATKKDILIGYAMSGGDATVDFAFSTIEPWALQATWASLDDTDATIALQQSLDGTNFVPLSGDPTITMTGTSDSGIIEDDMFAGFWMRVVVTANSVTSGTLSVSVRV